MESPESFLKRVSLTENDLNISNTGPIQIKTNLNGMNGGFLSLRVSYDIPLNKADTSPREKERVVF